MSYELHFPDREQKVSVRKASDWFKAKQVLCDRARTEAYILNKHTLTHLISITTVSGIVIYLHLINEKTDVLRS